MAFEYTKQPEEKEIIAVDFSRRIPAGITVTSYTTTIETTSPTDPNSYTSHLVLGTPTMTGVTGKEKILAVMISEGVDGYKYRVSFKVTLSDGQIKEDDVWVIVKET